MNGFTFFRNYYEAINDPETDLTEEEQGRLYNAIFAYVFNDEEPNLKGACRLAFNMIKPSLDVSKARGESKRNKSKSKEIKKNQNESNQNQNESKHDFDSDLTFFEKEEERREKKEDNIPPSLRAGARDEGEELREFLQENGNIAVDNCSTASLDMDYPGLRRAFAESVYLREKPHDLSWVAKNAARILRGDYKDKPARSGAPPDGKGDLQLWQELVKALSCAKEETDYGALTYKMQDEESIERMGELYRGLSREITEYFDPNSFLELCGMDDKDLKFERARFLKALPDIRRKIAEVQDGA